MGTQVFSYKTVRSVGESEFKDRGSKFLGYCVEVEHQEAIKEVLKRIKEQHPKANHYCYAWRLGTEGIAFRSSDNGEPSGSAGRPIMRQIDAAGLTNVIVVVVRYFGGTLLGLPGLVYAYKTAAEACLSNVPKVRRELSTSLKISFGYEQMDQIMKLTKEMKIRIVEKEMQLFCLFELKVPLRRVEEFKNQLERLSGVELLEDNE